MFKKIQPNVQTPFKCPLTVQIWPHSRAHQLDFMETCLEVTTEFDCPLVEIFFVHIALPL